MVSSGSRLGPYEIQAALGAGGMGEVYRAHDSRLSRDVAIKVLPSAFSADPERLQRFEQEARSAAALNHPNILAVHDIGQHDGAPYIVSELLEGETLRERLNAGAIPVRKAVEYAIQIAHGLAAAHEKGIVHRDLKPENVFVTSDGRVKILDFGLAKLTQAEPALDGLSALPTAPPNTTPGVVLGTIGYMSPEQVRGIQADHRSDIFAFGTVLYEMLSGQRAFRGDTSADTISAILKEEPPDLLTTEHNIPAAITRIVGRCLEKSAVSRFRSADDLAFALEGLSSLSESVVRLGATPTRTTLSRRRWLAPAAALSSVAALSMVPLVVAHLRESRREPSSIRFTVSPPEDATFTGGQASAPAPAVSPDGRALVFRARRNGGADLLWLRSFDEVEARPLAGTEGGNFPFWSPDNRYIGFFADGKLKKIDIAGGPAQSLTDAPNGEGGTWSSEGVILFTGPEGVLMRVSAGGGDPVSVTDLDVSQKDRVHRYPHFLPDERKYLFFVQPSNSVRVGSLDSREVKTLLNADSKPMYAAPGYIVFGRDRTLMAQPFDASRAELTGDAVPIAEDVNVEANNGRAAFTVSDRGVLAYRTGTALRNTQITWFDRSGKVLQTVADAADYRGLSISPDDAFIMVHRHEGPVGGGLWSLDWKRGTMSRFTSSPSHNFKAYWSPDSRTVVFASDREGGVMNIYRNLSSGTGQDERLITASSGQAPTSWSVDGRFVVFESVDRATRTDLWVLPLGAGEQPIPFLRTEFSEAEGELSPNGRWMAYTSNETGTNAIYVQPFPTSGLKWSISPGGGSQPRWRRDGRELFYVTRDATGAALMAVGVRTEGAMFEAEIPRVLFKAQFNAPNLADALGPGSVSESYAVASDGQRFVGLVSVSQASNAEHVTVVFNWTAALQR